ncbi:MAG TPA: cellulase family glycosylhydrolase [Solirubrobacteraceae bacterium]
MARRLPRVVICLIATLAVTGTGVGVALADSPGPTDDGWSDAGMTQAPGGPYLVDSLGRRLELHGVNLVGKCGGGSVDLLEPGSPCVGPARGRRLAFVLSPDAADPGRRFTATDARTLAGMGFNVVRLGIIWEGLEPGPRGAGPDDPAYCAPHRAGTPFPSLGRADPYDAAVVHAYLARTDVIVRLLARAGLRVILDMHSDVYGSAFRQAGGTSPWNGEGAPPWATCTDRVAFPAPPGWGSAYLLPAVQIALHHFWANDVRADLQAQYARVWQAVARHYRGDADVVGYEVYNEPNDYRVVHFDSELECDYGGPAREPASCRASRPAALPDGLIGAIESADPTHVVLFEPSGDTDFGTRETVGIAEPLRFPRLALAFHVYGAVPAQLRQTLAERNATRTDQPGGPAWIMDEFGASNDAPASARVADDADGMGLSWAYWSAMQLHDPTGGDAYEGLLDQLTRRAYPEMAQALALPYPWATAGRPGPSSFDRVTQTYRYRYVVDPAIAAPTEIAIPHYTYPVGYTVTVSGGRVVSAADAPLLEIRAAAHAGRVGVTVRSLTGFPFPRSS